MKLSFKLKPLALCAALGLAGQAAFAEQTIGVQDGASATDAVATARVNIRVVVPKIVILRVGDANATVPQIDFTMDVGGLGAGNSQAYAGAIPPTFNSTIVRTNPAGATGDVVVGAWSNVAGSTLSCALGALGGATAFAAGATAGGVPGTNGITVTAGGTAPAHPGTTNLSGCDGVSTTALTARTVYNGTYTYASTHVAADLDAGTYGAVVTYTATAP
jgi:hypothetical protein